MAILVNHKTPITQLKQQHQDFPKHIHKSLEQKVIMRKMIMMNRILKKNKVLSSKAGIEKKDINK